MLVEQLMQKAVNMRSGLVRVSTYFGIANFLMLFGITLRWMHGSIAPDVWFPGWMIGGFSTAALLLAFAAWFDRRFVWPREFGIVNSVNPMMEIQALHAAVLLRNIDDEAARAEILRVLEASGHLEAFRLYEAALEGSGPGVRRQVEDPEED